MKVFDLATACKWIGNSPAVAAKHDAMSSDLSSDFARAAGLATADEKAQQPPSAKRRHGVTRDLRKRSQPRVTHDVGRRRQEMAEPDKNLKWAVLDLNQ